MAHQSRHPHNPTGSLRKSTLTMRSTRKVSKLRLRNSSRRSRPEQQLRE
ncbi:hypothetical protein OESDEN_11407 [Oesophagostomum dentatum]|uniref:Uncharacterized protein n=1 Tax=Oesophagostomum dentatum TaxID=61180 RepID=A0A0B1T048_OESDE|nr:hypothetical protein OESDEN_11407 [Oesophagostomum dentatum]